jgi:hypothetical protein
LGNNVSKSILPSKDRLAAYARFFATAHSVFLTALTPSLPHYAGGGPVQGRGGNVRRLGLVLQGGESPLAGCDELIRHAPSHIDFLLPHATWDRSPSIPPKEGACGLANPYRYKVGGATRLFIEYRNPCRTEGLSRRLVAIETDGAVDQAGSLKTADEGALELLRMAIAFEFPEGEPWLHYTDSLSLPVEVNMRLIGVVENSSQCSDGLPDRNPSRTTWNE